MKYEKIANYSGSKFRRITGVKRSTYEKMVGILKEGYARKHQRSGRPQKLSIEDLLFAILSLSKLKELFKLANTSDQRKI